LALFVPASLGKNAVIMPDLVGERWLGAAAANLGGDFCEVEIKYVVDPSLEQNTVISQSVSAGTKGVGSKNEPFRVTLEVSRKDENLILGDYALMSEEQAVRELENLGYKVTVEKIKNSSVPSGRVVSTSPAAGESTKINGRITVTVSE
jgi:beta-lactam-binding protein with PASTA domain